jgi:hypothetical protein
MMFRKLFIVVAVVAGLCAFDVPIENPRLPQVAQTEIVFSGREQSEPIVVHRVSTSQPLFLVYNEPSKSSSYHHHHRSLLIEYQQHHSSL